MSRQVQVPLWLLLGTALLVGGGIVWVSIMVFGGQDQGSSPRALATPFSSAPTEVVVSDPSTSPSVSAPPEPDSPSESERRTGSAVEPRGSLQVIGAPPYGQSLATGPCANWRLKFVNNSNTEVVEILFDPPSGRYTNFKEFDSTTQQHASPIPAEKPAKATLDVSLPPYGEQILAFQTCTSTPPPANSNYEFGATKPDSVSFMWVTGHTGVTPF